MGELYRHWLVEFNERIDYNGVISKKIGSKKI